jgi:catechol 2,3-dioxygenase-like lactoylglutathione lyase family enzyme
MEQRVSLITLGVADLKRSSDFYERLGWRRSMA